MFDNIMLLTDSYKVSHWKQYPPGSQYVYSYMEARGGEYDQVLFFGLQYFLKKYLTNRITQSDLEEAQEYWGRHLSSSLMFNHAGWRRIVEVYGGALPVSIHAVKEGTLSKPGTVLMTIQNTDPKLPWLTNWLETLLMQVWYPTTVATQSYFMRSVIADYLERTGDPSLIDFKLHDFGFRGSTSVESSALGAAAHLVNFKGTDTFTGCILAREIYNCHMAGYSIPAAEHSTITSWGHSREAEAYKNMLDQFPSGPVAVVSDSYDIFNACENIWGGELKDTILGRNGFLVIRPDSGDPLLVLSRIMDILGDKFGFTFNEKGYKVLNPKVRVIQGDGIDVKSLEDILNRFDYAGWSADNIAFGSGGGLLQKVNRDTCKFAIKCSAISINDEWQDVYKDPITDSGKRSKRGRFVEGLESVFCNGLLTRDMSLEEIRQRAYPD